MPSKNLPEFEVQGIFCWFVDENFGKRLWENRRGIWSGQTARTGNESFH